MTEELRPSGHPMPAAPLTASLSGRGQAVPTFARAGLLSLPPPTIGPSDLVNLRTGRR